MISPSCRGGSGEIRSAVVQGAWMHGQEDAGRFEGVVSASHYDFDAPGKQFLGAVLECSDAAWLLAYDEESPYHAFADRQVVVEGTPYTPEGQRLAAWNRKALGHLRVESIRVADPTAAAVLHVGPERRLRGRLERISDDPDRPGLLFMTSNGDTFHVVNDPAGAKLSADLEVSAYDTQLRASAGTAGVPHLWVVCPSSYDALWQWRKRRAGRSDEG